MKLALHIIAKDEYDQLERIVRDYSQYFDEVVIALDVPNKKWNGSCSEGNVKVFEYQWCNDFSHKRNFLADKTESDYYFRMDTDDIIEHPERIQEVFETTVKGNFDVIYFPYIYSRDSDGNCNVRHWRDTIIRKCDWIYWKKTIHENIYIEDQNRFKGLKCELIKIIHDIDEQHAEESHRRNIEYLLEEFKRHGKDTDPRTLSYLGRILVGRGEYARAIPFLEMLVEKSGWDDDKYFSWLHMAEAYVNLNNLEQAIACCNEALEINTRYPDAYIVKSGVCIKKGDYQKALDWVMYGLVRPIAETTYVVNPTIVSVTGNTYASIAYFGLGEFDKALHYLKEVKKVAPKSVFIVSHEKEFLDAKASNDYINSLRRIVVEAVTDKKNPETVFSIVPSKHLRDERVWLLKNTYCEPKEWSDKSVVFFCGSAWEDWADPSVITGIGGSEEAVIYLSRKLFNLGYEVTVFNNCGEMAGDYHGVKYRNYFEFNPRDKYNVIISWRHNIFGKERIAKKQIVWLHDVPDMKQLNDGIDKVIVLSQYHKSLLKGFPEEKILVSSNGINIQDFYPYSTIRNKNGIIYTSSYDRGLLWLLLKWKDVLRECPYAELHIYYGWNTWIEMEKRGNRDPKVRKTFQALMMQKGIVDHGRVGHKQLIKEFHKNGIWAYPSHFEEISCISAMKAQACGCVPVATNYAALAETIKDGVLIDGKMDETKADEYIAKLVEVLKDHEYQDEIRKRVLTHKEEFSWEKVAKQWDNELLGKSDFWNMAKDMRVCGDML